MNILTLNAGSATLKFKLFAMPGEDVLVKGGLDHPGGDGIVDAARAAIDQCEAHGLQAIGHRIVHGGTRFSEPTVVTSVILDELRTLRGLDPLHNPTETAMVAAGLDLLPNTPAVAVFDTAFHRAMPEVAWRYAIPHDLSDRFQLRRYGFHGLSYEYVTSRLLECLGPHPGSHFATPPETGGEGVQTRLIICHLGNGASVCAVKDGRSVDTSMGLTPLAGLVMGTRSGDVDPGVLLYLIREAKMSPDQVDDILNHQSGLLGLSTKSSDVRELETAAKAGDVKSELALEGFSYRVRKYIAAYAAAMGGVDAVAFTGGIGEHSADIRSRVCSGLAFLDLRLSDERNANCSGRECRITEDDCRVQAWVIPTDEERQVARAVWKVIGEGRA